MSLADFLTRHKNNDTMLYTRDRSGRIVIMQRGYYGWKRPGKIGGFGYDKAYHAHGVTNVQTIRLAINGAYAQGTKGNPTRFTFRKTIYRTRCSGWGPWASCKPTGEVANLVVAVDFRFDKESGRYGAMGQKGVVNAYCETRRSDRWCPGWVNRPRP